MTSDVLVEAQLAARADQAEELGECGALVGHAAENERGHAGVERCVARGEPIRDAVDHLDRYRRAGGRFTGSLAQVGLRLDRENVADLWWIRLEVQAVSGADLDDAPR